MPFRFQNFKGECDVFRSELRPVGKTRLRSKIESDGALVVSEFSFLDLCEGLLGMHRELAGKKQLTLDSDLSPDIPILRTDQLKLQRLLENLVSNAVKFTPEGGRVELAAHTDDARLVVDVTDTGVGISDEDQEAIFEKFRQADSSLTRTTAGGSVSLVDPWNS